MLVPNRSSSETVLWDLVGAPGSDKAEEVKEEREREKEEVQIGREKMERRQGERKRKGEGRQGEREREGTLPLCGSLGVL